MSAHRTLSESLKPWVAALSLLGCGLAYAIARGGQSAAAGEGQPDLRVHLGHTGSIHRVWLSRGGEYVLTVEGDGAAHLWQSSTGAELLVLKDSDLSVSSAGFSDDGRFLVTGHANGAARLWDLEAGNLRHLLRAHSSEVRAAAFAPGSALLATLSSDRVRLWDVRTGALLRSLDPGATGLASVAFSPGGSLLAAGSSDGALRVWRAGSWQLLYTLTTAKDSVPRPVFSLDDSLALACGGDGQVRVWESRTGTPIGQFEVEGLVAAAFLSGNGRVVAASRDGVTEWDVAKRAEVNRSQLDWQCFLEMSALSPDGRYLLLAGIQMPTGHPWGVWRLWDVNARTELDGDDLESPSKVDALAFSTDGGHLAIATGQHVTVHSLRTREERVLGGRSHWPSSAALDARSRLLAVGRTDGDVDLWDLERGGAQVGRLGDAIEATYVGFSGDSRILAVGHRNVSTALWDLRTQKELRSFAGKEVVARDFDYYDGRNVAAFSRDGKLLLTPAEPDADAISIVDVSKGSQIGRLFAENSGEVSTVALSRNSDRAAVGTEDRWLRIWDLRTRRVRDSIKTDAVGTARGGPLASVAFSPTTDQLVVIGAEPVAFSPDGNSLLTVAQDQSAMLWDLRSGRQVHLFDADAARGPIALCLWKLGVTRPLRTFAGHTGELTAAFFSPSGKFVVAGAFDGTTRIWDSSTAKEMAELISFTDGTWAVVTPDGRFDASNLEDITGMHWSVPDVPLRRLAIEIFMRDYYEPRLLPRLLACNSAEQSDRKACAKEFKPVRPLASLNRVQPVVEIERIEWAEAAAGRANVTVKVARAADTFPRNGRPETVTTDVYDLRLFRNGQLVGWAPRGSVEWQRQPRVSEEPGLQADLPRWRELTHIPLEADGTARLTFQVQVPRRADLKEVTLTAYAFNEDRVKSMTAAKTVAIPTGVRPRQGKAYVISVGVNRTESSPAWDLQYAANDARRMSRVVKEKLDRTKLFEQVVAIPLVSDEPGRGEANELPARKEYLKAVLDLLAGRDADGKLKPEIFKIAPIENAQPEDLVLLAVSSHGYTDTRGIFHFVLQDVDQPQKVTATLDQVTLNTDELSAWLREVDGGELVMIVDACESEATIQAEGFKPGPMGSRGLGQLAYDKGIRVLAASKARESAIERGGQIRHGLLSYALVQNGLIDGLADWQPKDRKITIGEWLGYGEKRVPELFAEGDAKGTIQIKGAPEGRRDAYHGAKQTPARYQQPVLFDFSKNQDQIVVTLR